MIKVFQMNL